MLTPFALLIAMFVSQSPVGGPPAVGYGIYSPYGYSWPYRECDATNADGICIAWHSTLKGIDPRRFAQCNPWHCDLRPQETRRIIEPVTDVPPVEHEQPFEPHVIDLVPFNKANAIPGAR